MQVKRFTLLAIGFFWVNQTFGANPEETSRFLLFFGRFHPLILHLPIGGLLLVFYMDIMGRIKKNYPEKIISNGLAFSSIFAILACILGYFLSLEGGYEENSLNWHMYTGILTAILITGLYFLLTKGSKKIKKFFLPGFVITIIALSAAGHYGSVLTHGDDFLTEYTLAPKEEKWVASIDSLYYYNDVVYPILDNKCASCHNSQKRKGELSLATPEDILKGGENGKVILSGSAHESELINLQLLPIEDKRHMPPKGKEQITKEERWLLEYWINNGANFENKIIDYKKNDTLNKLLQRYIVVEEVLPKEATASAIKSIIDVGFHVTKIVADKPYLRARFVKKELTKKALKELTAVAGQLQQLDLNNSDFNDNLSQYLSKFTSLESLRLDNTMITDKALANLKDLGKLRVLNLHNTNITSTGIAELLEHISPKNIYLWNTKTDGKLLAELQETHNVKINKGIFEGFAEVTALKPPFFSSNQSIFVDSISVSLSNDVKGAKIFYTLDGKEPDSTSSIFKEPLLITELTNFKAKAFKGDWLPSTTVSRQFFKVKHKVNNFELQYQPDNRYPGANKLFDLEEGSLNFSDGKWTGYLGDDLVANIRLDQEKDVENITVSCLEDSSSWILFPVKMEVYGKDKNEEFAKIGEMPLEREGDVFVDKKQRFTINFPKIKAKELKVIVRSSKVLPKWHEGAGEKAWLFVDEILVW